MSASRSSEAPSPAHLVGEWARLLFATLREAGVRDLWVSPGSRSTPFTWTAQHTPGLRLHPVIDERSAAFLALGHTRVTGQPCALLCTSGSAAANYFPAVVEAALAHLPLVVLTADRPVDVQHAAAPQAMDQLKLYGDYARAFFDLGLPDATPSALSGLRRSVAQAVALATGPLPGPVHLNLRARKPLEPVPATTDAEHALTAQVSALLARPIARHAPITQLANAAVLATARTLSEAASGVIVVGPLPAFPSASAGALSEHLTDLVEPIAELSRRTGFPIFAEASSQVRFSGVEAQYPLFDWLLSTPSVADQLRPELLLCIGGVPTSSAFERWAASIPRRIVLAEHGHPDPLGTSELVASGHLATALPALIDHFRSPLATPAPPLATPAPPLATPAPPLATPAPPLATPAPPLATPAPPLATPAPPLAAPASAPPPSNAEMTSYTKSSAPPATPSPAPEVTSYTKSSAPPGTPAPATPSPNPEVTSYTKSSARPGTPAPATPSPAAEITSYTKSSARPGTPAPASPSAFPDPDRSPSLTDAITSYTKSSAEHRAPTPPPAADRFLQTLTEAHAICEAVLEQALDEAAASSAKSASGTPAALLAEGAAVRALVHAMPDGAVLVLGNSLPIRDVEAYVPRAPSLRVVSQRGANGIDGLVSGAIGSAIASRSPTLLLLGDVSLLHDVGGLASAGLVKTPLVIAVVDNAGGRIFDQLPVQQLYARDASARALWLTPPASDFAHAAALFGLRYAAPTTIKDVRVATAAALVEPGVTLLHVRVNPDSASALRTRILAELSAQFAGKQS